MAKGGSKVLTGVIAFILGFLFAIIVEVGAVFGVYWYAINTDLDSLMSMVGINNTDADGNKIYINTDPASGGAQNLKELFAGLKGLVYDNGEMVALGKSFDDFEQLIPATQIVLGYLYSAVGDYMELDREEFESTPMSGLMQVISDSVMNIKTAQLFEKLEIPAISGEGASPIVKSLFMGSEAQYATVQTAESRLARDGESNFKLPVFYDYYVLEPEHPELGPVREVPVNGAYAYPTNLGTNDPKDADCWLTSTSDDEEDGVFTFEKYYLYYVPCRVTENGIEEAEYKTKDIEITDGTGEGAKTYRFTVLDYGEDTDFIAVKPDNHGNFVLNYTDIYNNLNQNATGASDRFTGYSYYNEYARNYYFSPEKIKDENTGNERWVLNTISGKNYFRDNAGKLVQTDALTLGDIVNDPFRPLDSILIVDAIGQQSDVAYKIFKNTTVGALMRGEVDFDKLANDMEVSVFINNVSPSNKIMAYIVHRLADLTLEEDGTYTAVYDKYGENERQVKVLLEDGYISKVTEMDGATNVKGVLVNEVAALANKMSVTLLMDVPADDAVLAYMGYGINNLKPAEQGAVDALGNAYDYTAKLFPDGTPCYVSMNENGNISSVWYIEDGEHVSVKGTTISDIAGKINGITDALTIGDVIDVESSDNMLLKSIADTPISGLEDAITDLTVEDIFTEEEINASAVLRSLKGKKLTELSTAIDGLYIQSIYAEEVYGLPEDTQPMPVIDFDSSYKYYVFEQTTEDGVKTINLVPANGDGTLTQEQFDGRGVTEYYTYGTDEGIDGAKLKLVGYKEERLYYTLDENEAYVLVELNVPENATETERDDTVGYLKDTQYEDGKYYAYGSSQGMWRLVLNKNKREKAYTLNNFNNMVNVCSQNVYEATLGELQDAGLITDDIKGKQFNYIVNGTPHSVQLEELTLQQLIEIVLQMST
ncbi:MAG: hypothetical protein K2N14_01605 [Clostridia bacterium]|nr:hypothetical protein [Clostridia bacterium]